MVISASGASAVGQLEEVRVGLTGGLDRDSGLKLIFQDTNGASTSSPGVPSRFVGQSRSTPPRARSRARPRALGCAVRASGASPEREEPRRVELRTHTRNYDAGETREI